MSPVYTCVVELIKAGSFSSVANQSAYYRSFTSGYFIIQLITIGWVRINSYFCTYYFYPNSCSTPTSINFCPSMFAPIFLSQLLLQYVYFYSFLSIYLHTYSFYPNQERLLLFLYVLLLFHLLVHLLLLLLVHLLLHLYFQSELLQYTCFYSFLPIYFSTYSSYPTC